MEITFFLFFYAFFIRLIKVSMSNISSSSKELISSIVFDKSSGFECFVSKNSAGVMLKYSHMEKNSLIEGSDFPEVMLLIYPLLCPKS